MMVCTVFQLLESQYHSLLGGRNFLFEQLRICFYDGCSVGLLPDRIFQNYVAHGVPSRPTNPARWATRSPAVSLQGQSYIFLFDASGIRCQTVCVSVPKAREPHRSRFFVGYRRDIFDAPSPPTSWS